MCSQFTTALVQTFYLLLSWMHFKWPLIRHTSSTEQHWISYSYTVMETCDLCTFHYSGNVPLKHMMRQIALATSTGRKEMLKFSTSVVSTPPPPHCPPPPPPPPPHTHTHTSTQECLFSIALITSALDSRSLPIDSVCE